MKPLLQGVGEQLSVSVNRCLALSARLAVNGPPDELCTSVTAAPMQTSGLNAVDDGQLADTAKFTEPVEAGLMKALVELGFGGVHEPTRTVRGAAHSPGSHWSRIA